MAINGSVIVWINAFIPKEVPGVTETIKQGENSGKTALPLPAAALAHPFNFLKQRDYTEGNARLGYLTDQRGFSSDMGTSVRMQSNAKINLYPPNIVSSDHFTSGTREVDINSGKTLGREVADMSDCSTKGPYKLPIIAPTGNLGVDLMGIFNYLVNTTTTKDSVYLELFRAYKIRNQSDYY